jgi:hypothetical protein
MVQELETNHLLSQIRAIVSSPSEMRINFVLRDSFVPYALALESLSRMEELRTRPRTHRPEGLLIAGATGNGKTSILREFLNRNLGYSTPDVEIKPVLYVISPATAGESRLLASILRSFGYEKWELGSVDVKMRRVLNALLKCKVQVLVIDEIHNMLTGRQRLWESLNVVKTLSNELELPIMLAGIETAKDVVREDPQVSSRFRLIELPTWKDGKEYRDFLCALESTLPLAKPSKLYEKEKAVPLLELSKGLDTAPVPRAGILGNLVKLVKESAVQAIKDSSELISVDHLRSVAEKY